MIYQHEARAADNAITDAINAHVEDEARREDGYIAGALRLEDVLHLAVRWLELGVPVG
jgi:hypothetical protein